MDTIINYEREKFDELYSTLEYLIINLEKANYDMNKQSKNNLIDKIRLFNKDLDNLQSQANNILLDIKNKVSLIDSNMDDRLIEEENTNRMIRDFTPLLLLYTMNTVSNANYIEQTD